MLVLLWLYHVGTTGNLQLDESHFISVSIFNYIYHVCNDARIMYLSECQFIYIPAGLGHYRSIRTECVTFICCHFICN